MFTLLFVNCVHTVSLYIVNTVYRRHFQGHAFEGRLTHSITDFEINAFLNQDSYRLLKFVSDLVSIFDTG
jgi:hypothetical protein